MGAGRSRRTEVIAVRVTPEELAAIQRVAEKERMKLAEFVRAATFMYMAIAGHKFAWKLLGAAAVTVVRDHVRRFKQEEEGPGGAPV